MSQLIAKRIAEVAEEVALMAAPVSIPASDMTRAEARAILRDVFGDFEIQVRESHRFGKEPALDWRVAKWSNGHYTAYEGISLRDCVTSAVESARAENAVERSDADEAELRS